MYIYRLLDKSFSTLLLKTAEIREFRIKYFMVYFQYHIIYVHRTYSVTVSHSVHGIYFCFSRSPKTEYANFSAVLNNIIISSCLETFTWVYYYMPYYALCV